MPRAPLQDKYRRIKIVLFQPGVQPLEMLDNRALVFVHVEFPTIEPRLVQRLRGKGAAVPRGRVAAGETGEAAEAPHRHRHSGARWYLSSQE